MIRIEQSFILEFDCQEEPRLELAISTHLLIMDVKEFQRLAVETVDKIDEKAGLNRDAQLGVSQLIEELGELAKEANREKLRNQKSPAFSCMSWASTHLGQT